MLLLWNVASVDFIAGVGGLQGIGSNIDILEIIQSFYHYKLSSISQLVNGKSRDL